MSRTYSNFLVEVHCDGCGGDFDILSVAIRAEEVLKSKGWTKVKTNTLARKSESSKGTCSDVVILDYCPECSKARK